jgi:hypothetical protein
LPEQLELRKMRWSSDIVRGKVDGGTTAGTTARLDNDSKIAEA